VAKPPRNSARGGGLAIRICLRIHWSLADIRRNCRKRILYLGAIPANPASHPCQLAWRHVFAKVGDIPGGSPVLPAEICIGPMATLRVIGAATRRFAALHKLADQMRPFALVFRHGQIAVSARSDAFYPPKRASHAASAPRRRPYLLRSAASDVSAA